MIGGYLWPWDFKTHSMKIIDQILKNVKIMFIPQLFITVKNRKQPLQKTVK